MIIINKIFSGPVPEPNDKPQPATDGCPQTKTTTNQEFKQIKLTDTRNNPKSAEGTQPNKQTPSSNQ